LLPPDEAMPISRTAIKAQNHHRFQMGFLGGISLS